MGVINQQTSLGGTILYKWSINTEVFLGLVQHCTCRWTLPFPRRPAQSPSCIVAAVVVASGCRDDLMLAATEELRPQKPGSWKFESPCYHLTIFIEYLTADIVSHVLKHIFFKNTALSLTSVDDVRSLRAVTWQNNAEAWMCHTVCLKGPLQVAYALLLV